MCGTKVLYRQTGRWLLDEGAARILRIAPEVRRRRKPERGVIEAVVARG